MSLPPWYRVVEVVGGPLASPAAPIRLLLGLSLLVNAFDTANALLVPVCGPGMVRRLEGLTWPCYPWGFEGPFADFWFWRSKAAYLTRGGLHIGLCAAGILATFYRRPRWLGLVLACAALVAVFLLPLAGGSMT